MFDHRALTLGTPRRVSASSMTSSWYSEPEMDQLDGDAPGDGIVGDRSEALGRVGRTHRQRGPESFAPGGDQVAGHIGEERILGPDRALECDLDALHVAGHRREAERVQW